MTSSFRPSVSNLSFVIHEVSADCLQYLGMLSIMAVVRLMFKVTSMSVLQQTNKCESCAES